MYFVNEKIIARAGMALTANAIYGFRIAVYSFRIAT
jgi:hypothetical protein